MTGGTLVVVGSGPIGMASALALKDRFDRVVVLERQSKERFLRTRGFTFPIVFTPAALEVLERVGARHRIDRERSPYFGVVVHRTVLGRELTWKAKRSGIYSHWRHHIVASLHERLVEEGIDVHFESNVTAIDFSANTVTEATLGELGFDLLLGADGMQSQTRAFLAAAHPDVGADEISSELLDRWYAFRLPSTGSLAERFGNGDDGLAAHVHTSNVPAFPDDKFRVITVAMTQPRNEVSIVIKHATGLTPGRLREIAEVFFGDLVDPETLERAWSEGVGGEYRHVHTPTFRLGSALLVGDAAHGFEGNGDLINLGLSSVATLPEHLDRHATIPEALAGYDATVGQALRGFSDLAMRRSLEKITFEVAVFEAGALLGLNKHHPSMWGIYEDDFELVAYAARYERDRVRTKAQAMSAVAGALFLLLAWHRRG